MGELSFSKYCGFFHLLIMVFFSCGILWSHSILLCLLSHSLCGFLTSANSSFLFLNGNVATWVFVPSSTLMELLPLRVPVSCPLLMVFKLYFKGGGVLFQRSCELCDICCIATNPGKLLRAILWFPSLFDKMVHLIVFLGFSFRL